MKTVILTFFSQSFLTRDFNHSLYNKLKEFFNNTNFKMKSDGVFSFVETSLENSNLLEINQKFKINDRKIFAEVILLQKEEKKYEFKNETQVTIFGDFVFKLKIYEELEEILFKDKNLLKLSKEDEQLKILKSFKRKIEQFSLFDWKGNIRNDLKVKVNEKQEEILFNLLKNKKGFSFNFEKVFNKKTNQLETLFVVNKINNQTIQQFILDKVYNYFYNIFGLDIFIDNLTNKNLFSFYKTEEKYNTTTKENISFFQACFFKNIKGIIKDESKFEKLLTNNIGGKKSYAFGALTVF